MTDRHRSKEFLSFMKHVEKNTPKDQELHVILDNLSAHKTTMIMDWVDSHPRVYFYFTSISNILSENAIRPFVIGHKNWLFADTPKGAHASGIFYSLIETAKAHEIEPYAYLRHIFKALPYASSIEKIEALLPWNVKNQIPSKEKRKNQHIA